MIMEIILNTPPLNVYEHMALDEETVKNFDGGFVLRFYNWVPGPAATFGYAQFAGEVQNAFAARGFSGPFTRRPTGGGVVYHGEDLTFSCVFAPSQTRPADIYQTLHGLIRAALSARGIGARAFEAALPAAAYAPSVNHAASACFTRPVQNDLLAADGHKILGGAIRRFGDKVLYQGSLQTPGARTDARGKAAVIEALRLGYAPGLRPRGVTPQTLCAARAAARERFGRPEWIYKFS